jgi:hypothetical protein
MDHFGQCWPVRHHVKNDLVNFRVSRAAEHNYGWVIFSGLTS